MASTRSTYQGKPTITLEPEARFPFSFGTGKAKLIVDNIEAVLDFVAESDPELVKTAIALIAGRHEAMNMPQFTL